MTSTPDPYDMTTAYMVGYEKGKDAERARAEAVVEMLREVTSQHANGDIIQHYLDFRHHAGEACNWCAALDAYPKQP